MLAFAVTLAVLGGFFCGMWYEEWREKSIIASVLNDLADISRGGHHEGSSIPRRER